METKIEIPSCIKELDKSLKWARKIAKDPDGASQFEIELAASLLGIRNMLADARIFIGQCKKARVVREQGRSPRRGDGKQ